MQLHAPQLDNLLRQLQLLPAVPEKKAKIEDHPKWANKNRTFSHVILLVGW